PGRRHCGQRLQSGHQESQREAGVRAFAARTIGRRHPPEGTPHRGDHAGGQTARGEEAMSQPWPMVPLGDVLKQVWRPEPVDPEATYHLLGAHWYAGGLYTKDVKTGAEIQARTLYRVERGHFVYNRLFAWKGSFAIATAENHGCYVSNEFP